MKHPYLCNVFLCCPWSWTLINNMDRGLAGGMVFKLGFVASDFKTAIEFTKNWLSSNVQKPSLYNFTHYCVYSTGTLVGIVKQHLPVTCAHTNDNCYGNVKYICKHSLKFSSIYQILNFSSNYNTPSFFE